MARRYNKRVRTVVHEIGSLVMLGQRCGGKLQPQWRGPFKISGYGGTHSLSFTLMQLNGRRIRGTFHGVRDRVTPRVVKGREVLGVKKGLKPTQIFRLLNNPTIKLGGVFIKWRDKSKKYFHECCEQP